MNYGHFIATSLPQMITIDTMNMLLLIIFTITIPMNKICIRCVCLMVDIIYIYMCLGVCVCACVVSNSIKCLLCHRNVIANWQTANTHLVYKIHDNIINGKRINYITWK